MPSEVVVYPVECPVPGGMVRLRGVEEAAGEDAGRKMPGLHTAVRATHRQLMLPTGSPSRKRECAIVAATSACPQAGSCPQHSAGPNGVQATTRTQYSDVALSNEGRSNLTAAGQL